jgi:hypothetical protein
LSAAAVETFVNGRVVLQLLNFSVVPVHLQVPYVAAVSFVWAIILSMMRGSDTGAVQHKHAPQAIECPSTTPSVPATEAEDYRHLKAKERVCTREAAEVAVMNEQPS